MKEERKRRYYTLGMPGLEGPKNRYLLEYLAPKAFFKEYPLHSKKWDADLSEYHKYLVGKFNRKLPLSLL